MSTRKWPDIVGLHNVTRNPMVTGEMTYRAKIKLDGTNAGVRFRHGRVEAFQSRTQDITPEFDNAGFARWASSVAWPLITYHPDLPVTVLHGEWAGKGIQKGTSVSEVPDKRFFVFAVEFCSDDINEASGDWNVRILETEPEVLTDMVEGIEGVHVLPWHSDEMTVNFNDRTEVETFAAKVNEMVAEVEECDPYVKATFGVEGVGEGVVLYPVRLAGGRKLWSTFAFKAKGEKHRVKKAKVAAEIDPEIMASIDAFVAAFVTEQRCEQGLGSITNGEPLDSKHIGPFIGWVCKDVKKESTVELEVSGLDWADVQPHVTMATRKWIMFRYTDL